jgi:alpha-1,6-mannosyltransferase
VAVRVDPSPRVAPRAVGAIAASALTLFVMALVAAGRGSPYQPILTPNGRSKGWLRDLARAVGLEDITGNASLAVGVLTAVAAVAAFVWLLRVARRGELGLAPIAVIVVAAHVVVFFLPLLFSRDVYSYAYYGRIEGVYGANPYVATPLDHSGDLLWTFVGPKWVDTPAVYGPAWTTLSTALAKVLPKPIDHVEAYRLLAIVASLATCAAIVVVTRRMWPERSAYALAAFGANPIVLFHSVASGHNDLLIALAVVVAAGFLTARWYMAAVVALTLGALVKATAGLPLVLLIVWLVARREPGERWRGLVRYAGPAVLVAVAFAAPYLQLEDPTLGMLELASHEGWLAPSAVIGRLLDVLSFGTLGWVVRLALGVLLLLAMITLGKAIWRRASDEQEVAGRAIDELVATWGWSLVLLALLGPVLLPWYVVWALPVVWLLPREPRVALIATSVLLAVTLWSAEPLRFPGAFDLNLFVGRWIVTPILLVLALRALRDLRRRADLGLAFAERRFVVGDGSGGLAHGEEHVPAPAGHR